jgi:hypothetical protein
MFICLRLWCATTEQGSGMKINSNIPLIICLCHYKEKDLNWIQSMLHITLLRIFDWTASAKGKKWRHYIADWVEGSEAINKLILRLTAGAIAAFFVIRDRRPLSVHNRGIISGGDWIGEIWNVFAGALSIGCCWCLWCCAVAGSGGSVRKPVHTV